MQYDVSAAVNSSAFVHPLHESTVGMIGPLQREHFLPASTVHNNGIHFAGTNGMEDFLGFAQSCDQFPARKSLRYFFGGHNLAFPQPNSAFHPLFLGHSQVQPEEHFFKVRQVPNEPSQRKRGPLDKRGHTPMAFQ